jgi:hypothetical protein
MRVHAFLYVHERMPVIPAHSGPIQAQDIRTALQTFIPALPGPVQAQNIRTALLCTLLTRLKKRTRQKALLRPAKGNQTSSSTRVKTLTHVLAHVLAQPNEQQHVSKKAESCIGTCIGTTKQAAAHE